MWIKIYLKIAYYIPIPERLMWFIKNMIMSEIFSVAASEGIQSLESFES